MDITKKGNNNIANKKQIRITPPQDSHSLFSCHRTEAIHRQSVGLFESEACLYLRLLSADVAAIHNASVLINSVCQFTGCPDDRVQLSKDT